MKLDAYWTDSAPAFRPQARDLPPQVDVAVVGGGFTGPVGGAGAGQARRQRGGAGGRRTRGGRGLRAQRRARQQRARGRLRRGRGQGRRGACACLVPRLRRRGRRGGTRRARRGHRLRLRAPRQAQAGHKAGAPGSADAQRRAAGGRRRRHRRADPARAARARRGGERPLRRRPALQAQRPDAHGPLRRTAWRRRPSAAARRSTPPPACSGSSAWAAGGQAHRVHTSRGTVRAQQVLLATGAARHGGYASFGWLRRRIVPIGSFIIVTEPLGEERAMALLRERRTYVTVANIHHYFRFTPRPPAGVRRARALCHQQPGVGREERRHPARRHGRDVSAAAGRAHRLLLGRPGRRDAGPPAACRRARRPVLLHRLQRPRHADVGADGRAHGGRDGRRCRRQPLAGPDWPAIPGHVGPPWFLPAVGLYYRLKDDSPDRLLIPTTRQRKERAP